MANDSGEIEVDRLFAQTYEELRRLAARVKERDGSATLNPTALVHEAWLKLRGSTHLQFENVLHFKRIAAHAMRQVLVEAARRRSADKRFALGVNIPVEDVADQIAATAAEVLALDRALSTLERLNPRQCQLVEIRFFAGLEVDEAAAALQISESTALRDWRVAKAWLSRELSIS